MDEAKWYEHIPMALRQREKKPARINPVLPHAKPVGAAFQSCAEKDALTGAGFFSPFFRESFDIRSSAG
jgi:hypothetical protein